MKIKSFFLGILAAFGALVLEIMFSVIFPQSATELNGITFFLILIVLIEELAKGIFIYKNSLELQTGREIFENALLVGIGFSFIETIFNFMSPGAGSREIVLFGLAGALLVHLATSGIMGYYLAKNPAEKFSGFLKIIIPTFVIHLAYNSLLIYSWSYRIISICSAMLIFALLLMILSIRRTKIA